MKNEIYKFKQLLNNLIDRTGFKELIEALLQKFNIIQELTNSLI